MVLLRLCFADMVQLIPEEAYYWYYSHYMAMGYLDHPPMVAWSIWLSNALFGTSEFTVRLPALAFWALTAFFMFRLSKDLYGTAAARVCVILLACLPYFFGAGLLMTPDAPLMAFWAGTLLYLERALLQERSRAWPAAGFLLGLGLLSKYTIALLVPAALLFALWDSRSRRWLGKPAPYLALGIAAAVFSPVIWWNFQHDWISFSFQTARRAEEDAVFALHRLILYALILLSPVVLFAATQLLMHPERALTNPAVIGIERRSLLFGRVFTIAPLSVFVLASLFREVRPNWTGPVWLGILPAVSAVLVRLPQAADRGPLQCPWRWIGRSVLALPVIGITILALLTIWPHWIPESSIHSVPVAWRQLGSVVERMEENLERETQQEPLIAGIDTNALSSELAFYDPDGEGPHETAGSGLFGRKDLMLSHWFPPEEQAGRDILVVSRDIETLQIPQVVNRGNQIGPIQEIRLESRGRRLCSYYVRIIYGYSPPLFRANGEFGVAVD